MVVTIIKKAKKPPKKATCGNCGTVCGYLDSDVKEYNGTDYGGGPDGKKWIDCADCGEQIILDSW